MVDFVVASVSVPLPQTFGLGSWSGSVAVDRYGKWYWSLIGPGLGKATLTGASLAVTGNWLLTDRKPSAVQLSDLLSGHGVTATAGYWAGGNVMYSPGNGYAVGFGFVTPQVGANYSYSFPGSGNTGFSW
jgi:hypothetical protein